MQTFLYSREGISIFQQTHSRHAMLPSTGIFSNLPTLREQKTPSFCSEQNKAVVAWELAGNNLFTR